MADYERYLYSSVCYHLLLDMEPHRPKHAQLLADADAHSRAFFADKLQPPTLQPELPAPTSLFSRFRQKLVRI